MPPGNSVRLSPAAFLIRMQGIGWGKNRALGNSAKKGKLRKEGNENEEKDQNTGQSLLLAFGSAGNNIYFYV